jgi:hypothetical protein
VPQSTALPRGPLNVCKLGIMLMGRKIKLEVFELL